MAKCTKINRILGLGAASGVNVALLSILSLVVAKLLSVDDFGITRTATSYMIVLTMLGHFTLHDALSSLAGRTNDLRKQKEYFSSATLMVLGISITASLASIYIFSSSGFWVGDLQAALIWIAAFLPFLTLAILYNTSLQAVGKIKHLSFITLMNAIVPVLTIVPLSYLAELDGWIYGRIAAYIILLFASFYFVRDFFSLPQFHPSSAYALFTFAKVQILSGLLSLFLLSGDIIILERVTGDIREVAYYGLAAFFVKAFLFIPAVLGRVYFKTIADFNSGSGIINKIPQFLTLVTMVCLSISLFVYFTAPIAIEWLYGDSYSPSKNVVEVLAIGLVAMGLWQAFSTINVACGTPKSSVVISSIGSLVALSLMLLLAPRWGAVGAAWAMVCANFAGVLAGFYLAHMNGLFYKDHAGYKNEIEYSKP